MNDRSERQAWASYWTSVAPASGGGCLAQAADALEAAQNAVWTQFAETLPRNARVLDLGTGNGAVLARLARVRRDLELLGVDSAPSLPAAPKGMVLKPAVAIEELPFAPDSFDAVTSQFGYEYADTDRAAGEVARILKPGGSLQLVIHRRDSAVVAHNLGRREALRWALAPGGWVDRARQLLSAPGAAGQRFARAFRGAPLEAQRLFPRQRVASEITTAVVMILERAAATPGGRPLDDLQALQAKARNEIARLDALERAACDADCLDAIVAGLRAAGLQADREADLIDARSNSPFAWLVRSLA